MRASHSFRNFVPSAALALTAALAMPAAHALPFSAQVMAGLSADGLVRVGTLDFEIAAGDGSVRTFDYLKAFGDGSVRKAGDGSVRTCDGSVMPADGVCEAGAVNIGSFSFDGSVEIDPSLIVAVGAVNNIASPLFLNFVFQAPFVAGPYDSLAATLAGSGSAQSIVQDGLVDGNVISAVNISCATPGACGNAATSLSPVSGTTGTFALSLSFTLPAATTAPSSTSMNGSLVLSQSESQPVPEPATLALFTLGLLGAGAARRRRD